MKTVNRNTCLHLLSRMRLTQNKHFLCFSLFIVCRICVLNHKFGIFVTLTQSFLSHTHYLCVVQYAWCDVYSKICINLVIFRYLNENLYWRQQLHHLRNNTSTTDILCDSLVWPFAINPFLYSFVWTWTVVYITLQNLAANICIEKTKNVYLWLWVWMTSNSARSKSHFPWNQSDFIDDKNLNKRKSDGITLINPSASRMAETSSQM